MSTKRIIISTLGLLSIVALSYAAPVGDKQVKYTVSDTILPHDVIAPNDGMIADLNLDKETAIKLAESALVYIYGKSVLAEKPWNVTENKNEIKIKGTLHSKTGSVAEIIIRKSDGKIISYSH